MWDEGVTFATFSFLFPTLLRRTADEWNKNIPFHFHKRSDPFLMHSSHKKTGSKYILLTVVTAKTGMSIVLLYMLEVIIPEVTHSHFLLLYVSPYN